MAARMSTLRETVVPSSAGRRREAGRDVRSAYTVTRSNCCIHTRKSKVK